MGACGRVTLTALFVVLSGLQMASTPIARPASANRIERAMAATQPVQRKEARKRRTSARTATHRTRSAQRRPSHRGSVNARRNAERDGFRKVSSLVNFPEFFPGIGILYVKPGTLPHGPFLAFDRRNRLVSTIYMVPISEFDEHKTLDFEKLREKGDHVTLYFNAGHAGVDVPHYHVVVWHVSKADEKRVAR